MIKKNKIMKALLLILVICVSFIFLVFGVNGNKTDYKIKFDRYNIQSNELIKDNLLKAIQFNIKTKEINIKKFKKFSVSIKNNNNTIVYHFFKYKNSIKYYVSNVFGKSKYVEDSWYYCDLFNCSFAVQYYPEIYSGSLSDNNFEVINKNKESEYFSIKLKDVFENDKILDKNNISLSIKKSNVYIKIKKESFHSDPSDYNIILEYRLENKKIRDNVFIDNHKLLKNGSLTVNIGHDKDKLKYLSLFVYDNKINYENKLVIIGK